MEERIEPRRSSPATVFAKSLGVKGFSLLELLVVLVLVGLTSTLVLPAMGRRLDQLEVRKSALRLAAVARDLRTKAIYLGSLQRLVLLPSDNGYRAAGERFRLPSKVRITSVVGGIPAAAGDGRQFHFYPNGRMHGGEIGLSSNKAPISYRTRFDPLSGKVQVLKGPS